MSLVEADCHNEMHRELSATQRCWQCHMVDVNMLLSCIDSLEQTAHQHFAA